MLSKLDKSTSGIDVLCGTAQQDRSALESTPLGTKSSNTVPSTSITHSATQVLRTGIDSLYLTYRGEMSQETAIRLEELKELARSERGSDISLAQFSAGYQLLEVRGNGRHPYAYVLIDGWFRLELAKEDAKFLPMAYCRIASTLLTSMGHEAALVALNDAIKEIGAPHGGPNVSRIDVCVDFTSDCPLDQLSEHEFVTKARSFSRHTAARQFSGFSFSAGSPTSARLYNKSLEMQTKNHPRPDLEEIWLKNGWDGEQNVWRLEFQVRRATLAAFNLVPYSTIKKALPELWAYCTLNWLRHTLPNSSDSTQSRWPTSALWKTLQLADWGAPSERSLSRTYPDKGRSPSDNSLFVNGLSTLTSYAAREGYFQMGEVMEAYMKAARYFHDNRAQKSKEIGLGMGGNVDFDEYCREKIEQKRRSYNTGINKPLNDGIHPADKAVAREYRKRSNGE